MAQEKISLEQVRHVARLARLELAPAEEHRLQVEMSEMLGVCRQAQRTRHRGGRTYGPGRRSGHADARGRGHQSRGRRGDAGQCSGARGLFLQSAENHRVTNDPTDNMASELNRLTITAARERLRRREISARELTRACLDRIAAVEPRVNAFITVSASEAMAQAEDADRRLARGDAPDALRHPIRHQGHLLYARRAHDLRLEDSRRLHSAVRRHRGRKAPRRGRGLRRQGQPRRIRDGLVDRKLGLWPDAQSS